MPTIHRHMFEGEGRFNPVTLGQFDDAISAAIADDECEVLLSRVKERTSVKGLISNI